eukprot:3201072-Prymnesium_polylepis.1
MLCASARYHRVARRFASARQRRRFGVVRPKGLPYSITSSSEQTCAKTEPPYQPSQSRHRVRCESCERYLLTKLHMNSCCVCRAS